MAMLLGGAPGTDIVLTEERILSARAFANKIGTPPLHLLNMERSGVEAGCPRKASATSRAGGTRATRASRSKTADFQAASNSATW